VKLIYCFLKIQLPQHWKHKFDDDNYLLHLGFHPVAIVSRLIQQ